MFGSATRRLLHSVKAEDEVHQWMSRIAARLPAAGVWGSQLQALIEDEFPAFSPSLAGAVTLKEAVLQYPALLHVDEGTKLQSKWFVRPLKALSAPAAASASGQPSAAVQKLQQYCGRRLKYGHNGFVPLELAMAKAGVEDVSVVNELLRRPCPGLEVQAGVRVKPRRVPRDVVAFVDGDALPAIAVDEMCNELNVLKDTSAVTVVRQRGSHPLSAVDVVCPDVIPTYLCIEKHAHELRLRRPDVRQDVVYMCSITQFETYAEHVAPLNPFPDADVYVCCPSKIVLVQPKRVIPFE